MQVAIRDMKANLSRILSRARAGESIEVTSHHKPIARIIGIPSCEAPCLGMAVSPSWPLRWS